MHYESVLKQRSEAFPEVSYTVRKISFGRRLELAKEIRELSRRMEFAAAGKEASDEMDASILSAEIERLYIRWELVSLEGLAVDGAAASHDLMLEQGPETLTQEILRVIQAQCGLSEEERKN